LPPFYLLQIEFEYIVSLSRLELDLVRANTLAAVLGA
jgi:hypothetical protein